MFQRVSIFILVLTCAFVIKPSQPAQSGEVVGIPLEMSETPCKKFEKNKGRCFVKAPASLKEGKFKKFTSYWKKSGNTYRLYRIYAESSAYFKATRFNAIKDVVETSIGGQLACETQKLAAFPGARTSICKFENNQLKVNLFGAGGGGGASRYSLDMYFENDFTGKIQSVAKTATTPSTNSNAVTTGSTESGQQQNSSSKLDIAKKECAEIGYTPKTEKFADCVMKLID